MTKLYIFEGVPGSGKTSSAKWLASRLGDKAKLFLEGDPQHPADYESVACLTEEQVKDFEREYPSIREMLIGKGERYFISYMGLYEEDKELFDRVKAFDVYELPVEDYLEVALERWKEFVQQAWSKDDVYILECCYLQNPFTFLLAKHNCSEERIFKFLQQITNVISALNPVVIYFEQDHLAENLEKIRQERPVEWFDFINWYYTGQEYGKARSLSGVSGVLHFLEERKELEKKFLQESAVRSIVINNTKGDWERIHHHISVALELV
jgi:hypothetical protein